MFSITSLAHWLRMLLIASVLVGMALLVQIMLLPAAGRAQPALVVFASAASEQSLPHGVSILDWSGHWARLANVDAQAARALYGAGALVVFPMRSGGCISLRRGP